MSTDEEEDVDLDWSSLKTIKKFDGIGDLQPKPNASVPKPSRVVFENGIYDLVNSKASTPVSLLVESLVQQLCTMLEPNPQKSLGLYNTICEHLHQLKLIDETYAMGEFEVMRSQYQRALYQLVSIARGDGLPMELDSVWPLAQPLGLEWSRYHREFEEIEFIAGGGFGKVFKARNRLDGILYAVKKITLKSTSINNVLLHLAEVKTLASLNHQNIVPYKAAWLEPLLVPQQSIKSDSDSEDSDTSTTEETEDEFRSQAPPREENSSSDFIIFQSGVSISMKDDEEGDEVDGNQAVVQFRGQQKISIGESQPHVKLKWATLFIQMTLCHVTLKEFLDLRNQSTNYEEFYARFIVENRRGDPNSEDRYSDGVHTSRSFDSYKSDPEGDIFERSLISDHPSHLEVVTNIFTQLLNGLSYIHSRKIVHHDIKPSNIFVSVEASGKINVQLGDFGLACPLQEPHAGTGFGTPLYAAPEQLDGECNFKSDIYSLGIILLELLVPFSTDMERANTIKDVRKGKLPESISVNFRSLLKRLIDHRPSKRPDTSQLIEIMNKLSSNKDNVIVELQRRLSEQDSEIQSLRQEVEEHRRNRDNHAKDKDAEIELLRAKILEMEQKQDRDSKPDSEKTT